jgi:hypothetical protein
VVQFDLSDGIALFTTADTEDTEDAQRLEYYSLCVLSALCVSVVNASFILTQGTLSHYDLALAPVLRCFKIEGKGAQEICNQRIV